ncbi:MAG: hypothetical protein E6K69_06915 [Nitrospirae bacterium]|nr:MAG: hypothetical protein E6K69_06915 [Nitrospirota bacterium]
MINWRNDNRGRRSRCGCSSYRASECSSSEKEEQKKVDLANRIALGVTDAYLNLQTALQQVNVEEKEVESAKSAFTLAKERYPSWTGLHREYHDGHDRAVDGGNATLRGSLCGSSQQRCACVCHRQGNAGVLTKLPVLVLAFTIFLSRRSCGAVANILPRVRGTFVLDHWFDKPVRPLLGLM